MIPVLISLTISLIISTIWAIGIHNSRDTWKDDKGNTDFP